MGLYMSKFFGVFFVLLKNFLIKEAFDRDRGVGGGVPLISGMVLSMVCWGRWRGGAGYSLVPRRQSVKSLFHQGGNNNKGRRE